MLKITYVVAPNAAPTLKLEGKLLEPWVEELVRACLAQVRWTERLRLDLSAVSFVDSAGAELLRDLISQGIQIGACSGYVAELLHVEKR